MTAIASNKALRGPVTAVPVVAGNGVRLRVDTDNNRVVAELDETVLFESDTAVDSFTTSEAIENFKSIKVIVNGQENTVGILPICIELPIMSASTYSSTLSLVYGSPYEVSNDWCLFWTTRYTRSENTFTLKTSYYSGANNGKTTVCGSNPNVGNVFKIVGIGRKQEA